MKPQAIEIARFKSIAHAHGLLELQVDASVLAAPPGSESSVLRITDENARVLQALLRNQLAEVDRRKGRSQR